MLGCIRNQNSVFSSINNGPKILYLVVDNQKQSSTLMTPYLSWYYLSDIRKRGKGVVRGGCSKKNGCTYWVDEIDPGTFIFNQKTHVNDSYYIVRERAYTTKQVSKSGTDYPSSNNDCTLCKREAKSQANDLYVDNFYDRLCFVPKFSDTNYRYCFYDLSIQISSENNNHSSYTGTVSLFNTILMGGYINRGFYNFSGQINLSTLKLKKGMEFIPLTTDITTYARWGLGVVCKFTVKTSIKSLYLTK